MLEVFQGSNLDEVIDEVFANQKPALENSRFVFDRVLFLAVNFHQFNLTQGSSYLPLPGWISHKKAVINPQNMEDEECFKWAVTAVLHREATENNPK